MSFHPNSDYVEDMELILALDLAGGLVVHGKSGNRAGYRPLSWGLAPSAEPETYLSVMRPRFLYIADLESIQGRTPQDDLVRRCAALVERCYLDRGFRSSAECAAVDGVTPVVGTETAAATIKDLREYPDRLSQHRYQRRAGASLGHQADGDAAPRGRDVV